MTSKTETNLQVVQLTLFDLEALEKRVEAGLAQFIEVGNALLKIKESEGYRLKGYKDFSTYCEKQFGFSDRHARRLMSGAEASETVKQITGETPSNEAVAREFARISNNPKTVERVAARLKSSGGVAKATAEKVATVIAQVTHKGAASDEKPIPAPKPPPPPPTFTDDCPHCGMTPPTYVHKNLGWHCGACDGPVYIGVVLASAAPKCPACGKDLAPNATYCGNCGSAL